MKVTFQAGINFGSTSGLETCGVKTPSSIRKRALCAEMGLSVMRRAYLSWGGPIRLPHTVDCADRPHTFFSLPSRSVRPEVDVRSKIVVELPHDKLAPIFLFFANSFTSSWDSPSLNDVCICKYLFHARVTTVPLPRTSDYSSKTRPSYSQ